MSANAVRAWLLLPALLLGLAGLGAGNAWFIGAGVAALLLWCLLTNGEGWQ